MIDGRPEAVREYLRHFWTHWSGPGFTPSGTRLAHLRDRYAAPGAFTASIAWYRAGAGMVARSLSEHAPPPEQRLDTPASVLWPEHDPLFPVAWADRLEEFFTDARLYPVPGIGHFLPVEAPALLAERIAAVL